MDPERDDIAHLLRRAGFGGTAEEIEQATDRGWDATVDDLLDLDRPDPAADAVRPPSFDTEALLAAGTVRDDGAARAARAQSRREATDLVLWWLRRMVAAERPLREKLTWFWHGHFATSIQKVRLPQLMFRQNSSQRGLAVGDFGELVQAMADDPAMVIWLDRAKSKRGAPNENFARELLELFVLGHGHAGHQPYGEDDVVAAARALTGIQLDRRTRRIRSVPSRHDDATKTFLGQTGTWDGEDVVRIATVHPACAPHVAARLWSRLARPTEVTDPVVVEVAVPFAGDLDIRGLIGRMLRHPAFRGAEVRSGLVKQPVEWVVGCHRSLGLTPDDPSLVAQLSALDQLPFRPPSVGGWPANQAWLTTAGTRARLTTARALATRADIADLEGVSAAARPPAVGRRLGVPGWGPATTAALSDAADDPRLLLTLALVAPEHLLA